MRDLTRKLQLNGGRVRVVPLLALLLVACAAPGGLPAFCGIDAPHAFQWEGGMAPVNWASTLVPPDTLRITRNDFFEGTVRSCTTVLPACGTQDAVDAADVVRALAHPHVEAAWGTGRRVFGTDRRPVDGAVWTLRRGPDAPEAPAFSVGAPCDGDRACIPQGLLEIRDLLQSLQEQQLADPSCAALSGGRPPPSIDPPPVLS